MSIKDFNEVYKSYNYKHKYTISLNEDELFVLKELVNPNKHERLFGDIRAAKEQKEPDLKAKPHVQIQFYQNKIKTKYKLARNQLSLAMLYMYLNDATEDEQGIFKVKLNPLLLSELEYTISHDILRKMREITNLNQELEEEDISESYIKDCNENIALLTREIAQYEQILEQISKTVGKDGIYLIQSDMAQCELEGLNSLKLHMEACMRGGRD